MKRTWAGEVRNVSLLVASAVNSEGFREILGICEGAKEDKSGWSAFLRHLIDRGLSGVQLIISDACRGLMESAAEYLPEARWQRCMVHFYRNIFSHVPATKVRDVSHMLKAIHAQERAFPLALETLSSVFGARMRPGTALDFFGHRLAHLIEPDKPPIKLLEIKHISYRARWNADNSTCPGAITIRVSKVRSNRDCRFRFRYQEADGNTPNGIWNRELVNPLPWRLGALAVFPFHRNKPVGCLC